MRVRVGASLELPERPRDEVGHRLYPDAVAPFIVAAVSLQLPPHQLVATVVGAGTMGAQIAAHLANAGVRTHLLDIVPKNADPGVSGRGRNAAALRAIAQMMKGKPAPFMRPAFASRITAGNLEDDLERAVAESDLVIEAVIERLDIKQPLFDRIAKAAPAHAILATNTSGLPIGSIAENLPDSARKRVVGMHFFNPPRYMHLLEVVASKYTAPEVVRELSQFSDEVLGKGIVPCRDTPNFIGNRIGIAEMLLTFKHAFDGGYTVEEVDLLNGKLMGRPKTGSFRLGDLVGIDVAALVIQNLAQTTSADPSAPNYDELNPIMAVHPQIEKMFEKGMRGDKTNQGFYKKSRDDQGKRKILSLDLQTLAYRERQEPDFPELAKIKKMRDLGERVAAALRAEGRAGEFLRNVYLPLFNYAAARLGEIADRPKEIDDAMCWGYGWELGPFALWDAAGVAWGVRQLETMGIEVAPAAKTLLERQGEGATWYGGTVGEPTVWVPAKTAYAPMPPRPGIIVLSARKALGGVLAGNDAATLVDLGDGIACLEFHSKMNSLGKDVLEQLGNAVPTLEQRGGFRGLVVGNQGDNFSVGADAFMILALAGQKKWDELDQAVATFQQTMMSLRHATMPVVVAPHGMALGGGCECVMHGAAVVANAESYVGLVEVGVGLIPAGGGLKEIVRRASQWASQVDDGDPYPWVRRGFECVATAKVATSAHEAVSLGFMRQDDTIVFNKHRVIARAKQRAIALAEGGFGPPDRLEPIHVVGASRGASFFMGVQLFEWGGYASAHDKLIGQKIAHVLSGGMQIVPSTVTAQHLLDLEREAFISLCGEQKTRDRIAHMLQTGKPLRN
jgi:3-hydroxyacyl-CoA dehydrogenase